MHYLTPTQPYSWPLSLKRLTDMPRQVIGRVEPGPVYIRALDQDGRLGIVRISQAVDRIGAVITGDLDPDRTLSQVRRAFWLDFDLTAFHRHMEAHDPVLAGLAQRYLGARPIGSFDLWEALAWMIISQQITVAFAFQLKEALVRLGGCEYGGLPAFPGPERVAALSYEALQAEKYSRRKAEYVIDTARLVVDGRLDLESIVSLPFEEAVQTLTATRGIGRWTAECLLMEAGKLDAFPAGDIGIRNAVRRFYDLDHQPTEAEVRQIGAAWAPYPALACYYLWLGLLDRD